jgi:aerobic-type carbon monoxide dehydrogenase small subunit (CoxS/CutS family)
MTRRQRFTINGVSNEYELMVSTTLLHLIRAAGLTGAKEACGRGECGACTVMLGDRTVNACTTLAARVREPVWTIEGLAEESRGLRRAFAEHGAMQCGFCTPGMVVRAWWIVTRYAGPWDRAAIRAQLAGNICRCTGYKGIVDAILATHAAREASAAPAPEAPAAAALELLNAEAVTDGG